jgi:phospholipid/cholesterol/gamma-HCH transport system substrate-binding protein
MSVAFRLGLFIVGCLLILATGIFLIGGKKYLFHRTYEVRAQFQTVAGLNNGAEVRVGGIHEGTVRRIVLPQRPDGKVTVEMNLDRVTHEVLKTDSTAAIKSAGLLGDKYVDISFGSIQAEPLKDGATIETQPPLDISDLVKKTDEILDTTKDAMKNVDGTTSNLEAVSAKINEGKGTAGALINDKSVYQRVNAGATNFAEDMEALKHNFLLRGFFHKRGYEDSGDLTKHLVSQLPAEQPVKHFDFDDNQLFGKTDTAKVKNQKVLNAAGTFLQENPFGLAVVSARGGVTGDSDKVRVLTEGQAMSVREYLVQNFRLDDTRVKTLGVGKVEENPNTIEILVYPTGKTAASAQNRRPGKE